MFTILTIIAIIMIVIPLTVRWSGGGVVALSFSVTAVYAVSVLVFLALKYGPPLLMTTILNAISSLTNQPDKTFDDIYNLIDNLGPSTLPPAVFATIGIVFWALARLSGQSTKIGAEIFFWILHLAILALPIPFHLAAADNISWPEYQMAYMAIQILILLVVVSAASLFTIAVWTACNRERI